MIFTLRTEMYMTPVKHANTKFHSYVPYELLPCYFSPGSVGGGPSYELLHTTHAFAAGPRCTASTDLLTYLQGTDSVRRERTRPKRALHVQSHKQILLALRPFIIPLFHIRQRSCFMGRQSGYAADLDHRADPRLARSSAVYGGGGGGVPRDGGGNGTTVQDAGEAGREREGRAAFCLGSRWVGGVSDWSARPWMALTLE